MTANISVRTQTISVGSPADQMLDIKADTLLDAQRVLREEQAAGDFPEDKEDYELLLRNRGSETRRDLATINPYFLRFDYDLTWVQLSDDTEVVKDAAIYAVSLLRRRAPFFRGDYLASISIFVGRRAVSPASLRNMDLQANQFVFVAPNVKHASPIEQGYYKRQYDTPDAGRLRGGVVRPVAAEVRTKFGAEIAVRFAYISLGQNGGGTMPAIEIAVAGSFTQNDARPGSGRRRRRGRR